MRFFSNIDFTQATCFPKLGQNFTQIRKPHQLYGLLAQVDATHLVGLSGPMIYEAFHDPNGEKGYPAGLP